MSNANVQYVELYRPGRITIVIVGVLVLVILCSYFLTMYGIMSVYFMLGLIFFPFLLAILDSILRKRLLPIGKQRSTLASLLKKLKVRWILRKNGGGIRKWNRIEIGLPRTIADKSLEKQLDAVTIPEGLIEPEQISTSKPGSLLGCIIGVTFSIFVIWVIFRMGMTRSRAMYFPWFIILLMGLNILILILGLPSVHRSRKLPAFLRVIGRRRMFSKPIVVGPGWLKCGHSVWRADRDMFLVRRTGFRLASSEIDCMLVGPLARKRMAFSGVGDEDFQLLFGAWNVEDVRTEFIDSDLS